MLKGPLDMLDEMNQRDTAEAVVAEFNELYMVVNQGGKTIIYAPNSDPILRRTFYDRMTFDDLRRLYLNRQIVVGHNEGKVITKSAADIWLRHTHRRQFVRGVTFDPSDCEAPHGTLNLWTGFAIDPHPGDWSLMRSHIRQIICDSNVECYDYLMGWLARMVQNPAEQGEVAVVMKGGEGTGKGTLARALQRIFGQHSLAISNSKHLTGNFNAHLRDAVFLFADEAFFAGDKASVGVLKSLITEPYLTIEAKYANAIQTPNFLHIMMASNEEWVVPAALDARRFLVLEVAEAAKGQHHYFAEIWRQMDDGGYEAMLHDLLHHEISSFNVRRVPLTEGLQRQRQLTLGTTEAWWKDVLYRGYVFASKIGLEAEFGVWREEVSTALLFTSYIEFAERRRERHPLSREALGRFMRKLGAKTKRLKDATIGEHLIDVPNPFGGTNRKAATVEHPRPPGYHIGALDLAREGFIAETGLSVDWGDGDLDEEA